MLNELRTFFDHSRHKLTVRNVDARLDVLAFQGTEGLSQLFTYRVEFTCTDRDMAADQMLGQDASFSLYGAPSTLPLRTLTPPVIKPLRRLHGVVTGFKRLSGSVDEARYEITLQPRLALLGRGPHPYHPARGDSDSRARPDQHQWETPVQRSRQ